MPITLRVTGHPSISISRVGAVTFDTRGGTIGRAETNDWVLPDPDRIVSSQHAEVFYEDGAYHLRDLSTNGVYLNDGTEPIGKGASMPLANGDRLMMGDFELAVAIEADGRAPLPPGPTAAGPPFGADASPFGDGIAPFGDDASPDPFAGAGPLGGGVPLPPAGDRPTALPDESLDPLAALDQLGDDAAPADDAADWLAPTSGTGSPAAPRSHAASDQAASLDSHFQPRPPNAGVLPDDLELTMLGQQPSGASDPPAASPPPAEGLDDLEGEWWKTRFETRDAPAEPPAAHGAGAPSPAGPHPSAAQPSGEALFPDTDAPSHATPATGAPRVPGQLPSGEDSLLDLNLGERSPGDGAAAGARGPASPPPVQASPNPQASASQVQSPPAAAAVPPAATGDELAAVRALLEGAGLSPSQLPVGDTQQFMRTLGGMLREVVQGLHDVLAARTSLKNELRIQMTMMGARENNPLKFSTGVDDALTNLLLTQRPGFMPPLDAVHESFEDVRAHQMAMMAGMQAAFQSMLERFGPERLEERFASRVGALAKLPGQRKARYWELYRELYEEQTRDRDEAFQRLFKEEFVRAYEEQMVAFERARQQPF